MGRHTSEALLDASYCSVSSFYRIHTHIQSWQQNRQVGELEQNSSRMDGTAISINQVDSAFLPLTEKMPIDVVDSGHRQHELHHDEVVEYLTEYRGYIDWMGDGTNLPNAHGCRATTLRNNCNHYACCYLAFGKISTTARAKRRTATRLYAWSKTAEFSQESGTVQQPSEIAFSKELDKMARPYDLGSPREWLEFCEARKLQRLEGMQAGAGDPYTVNRCDYCPSTQEWRIWGQQFHLQRLKNSLNLLSGTEDALSAMPSEQTVSAAMKATQDVMKSLLREAEHAIDTKDADKTTGDFVVVMLTVLWELAPLSNNPHLCDITVRGHAFSSLQTVARTKDNPNADIQVSLGFFANEESSDLPTRFDSLPQAKLSSWCRRRRPLEDLFKGKDVGEVILVRKSSPYDTQSLELLEGLTSNLFVVTKDGVVQTPPASVVLGGYVRRLIQDVAENCGYPIEIVTLCLHDSSNWEEVFVSSSIRVIIPVSRILLPISKDEFDNIWERPAGSKKEDYYASNKLYRCIQKDISNWSRR